MKTAWHRVKRSHRLQASWVAWPRIENSSRQPSGDVAMSHMNRRRFVIAMSAAAAGAYLPFSTRAQGRRPDSITVRDPGGSYVDAFREAFYLPFEKKTGIDRKRTRLNSSH